MHANEPYEPKYLYLINKCDQVGLKHFKDPKVFIEYSYAMKNVYCNIEKYNLGKSQKVLIVFAHTVCDMISNKKLHPEVAELFIRGKKLNISLIFMTQSYFQAPMDVGLNTTRIFIMKISKKEELQFVFRNNLSDIEFDDFKRLYKKYTTEPYLLLVINTTFPSSTLLSF